MHLTHTQLITFSGTLQKKKNQYYKVQTEVTWVYNMEAGKQYPGKRFTNKKNVHDNQRKIIAKSEQDFHN